MNAFFIKKILSLFAGILLIVSCAIAFSEELVFSGVSDYSIQYIQKDGQVLSVGIRPHDSVAELSASIVVGKSILSPSATITPYPKADDKTAILFLVDVSSDKNRKRIIKKNIQQLQEILATGQDYQQFGLATFGEKFTIISPIGTAKDELRMSANTVSANENETLLYQLVGDAIDYLDQQVASRRVLVIFSDGKTEDNTEVYNDKYILDKVKYKNIIIIGLAFPRKGKRGHQVRYYQTLKHLADVTGGQFLKANGEGNLPQGKLDNLLETTNIGGYWNFNLTPLLNHIKAEEKIVSVLRINNQQQSVDIPLTIKIPATNKSITIVQQLLAILAFVAIALLFFLWKKNNRGKIYAYMDSLDGNNRYEINKKTYTIGRNEGNDLVLANLAVSSFHAQIHLSRDGDFIITDLNSVNKVYINNSDKEISSSSVLEDGDLIKIGEVRLRFFKQ